MVKIAIISDFKLLDPNKKSGQMTEIFKIEPFENTYKDRRVFFWILAFLLVLVGGGGSTKKKKEYSTTSI